MSLHIKNIMVTGGNAGIGFALCKQLVVEHGCRVFLGSRNADKGMDAVRDIRKALSEDCSNLIELVVVDDEVLTRSSREKVKQVSFEILMDVF